MKLLAKIVLVVLFIGAIFLGSLGWLYGATDSWNIGRSLVFAALGCIVAGIAIYPLAVREPGESYLGILKKYFF